MVILCRTTLCDASRLSISFMLTPALNSYSPRLSELRLPSSRVSSVNQVALSMTPARSSWSAMLPPSSSRTMLTILSAVRGPGLRASIISQATAPSAIERADQDESQERAQATRAVDRRGFFGFLGCGGRSVRDRRRSGSRGETGSLAPAGARRHRWGCAHAAAARSYDSLKRARGLRNSALARADRLYMTAHVDERRFADEPPLTPTRGKGSKRWCRRSRTNWTARPGSAACARRAAQGRSRSRPKDCRD